MSNQTFKQRVDKNARCPKCNRTVIYIHGAGWDYDTEYCSNWRECDYEVVYETTTDISEDKSNE